MTTTIPSLYEVLGAEGGIRVAVDDFYERVVADPLLAGYFAGIDLKSLRRHQTDMLIVATGGPSRYTGRDMAAAHLGLQITDEAFNKVVGHLGATLQAGGADQETLASVVAALAPLRSSIVTA
ncbi:MAG: group 1 truncated hemoglobin [Nakamurella sp.]